jgi:hypothetical protein
VTSRGAPRGRPLRSAPPPSIEVNRATCVLAAVAFVALYRDFSGFGPDEVFQDGWVESCKLASGGKRSGNQRSRSRVVSVVFKRR